MKIVTPKDLLVVNLELDQFRKMDAEERMVVLYSAILALQKAVIWRWKTLVMWGAGAGFIAGFVHDSICPSFILKLFQ